MKVSSGAPKKNRVLLFGLAPFSSDIPGFSPHSFPYFLLTVWRGMATQERFYWQLLQICRCRQPVYTILQRGTCVNWLMDVCEEVGATRSTYYLAMYISDVVFSGEHCIPAPRDGRLAQCPVPFLTAHFLPIPTSSPADADPEERDATGILRLHPHCSQV